MYVRLFSIPNNFYLFGCLRSVQLTVKSYALRHTRTHIHSTQPHKVCWHGKDSLWLYGRAKSEDPSQSTYRLLMRLTEGNISCSLILRTPTRKEFSFSCDEVYPFFTFQRKQINYIYENLKGREIMWFRLCLHALSSGIFRFNATLLNGWIYILHRLTNFHSFGSWWHTYIYP